MKALQHLKTINHHKWLVCQGCFKVGLYKQGLLHDLSKYSPTEFLVGCKFYQGTRSPNNAEREVMKTIDPKPIHQKAMHRPTMPKKKTREAYRGRTTGIKG